MLCTGCPKTYAPLIWCCRGAVMFAVSFFYSVVSKMLQFLVRNLVCVNHGSNCYNLLQESQNLGLLRKQLVLYSLRVTHFSMSIKQFSCHRIHLNSFIYILCFLECICMATASQYFGELRWEYASFTTTSGIDFLATQCFTTCQIYLKVVSNLTLKHILFNSIKQEINEITYMFLTYRQGICFSIFSKLSTSVLWSQLVWVTIFPGQDFMSVS